MDHVELVKLCRLASLAECGDHFWVSVPKLGLWAMACALLTRFRAGWRAADMLAAKPRRDLPAGI